MARKALAMILSDKVANEQFILIDDFKMDDVKTKTLDTLLNKLPIRGRKTMLLLSKEEVGIKKASDNLERTKTYKADSVNAQAAIICPSIVLSEKGLEEFMKAHKE